MRIQTLIVVFILLSSPFLTESFQDNVDLTLSEKEQIYLTLPTTNNSSNVTSFSIGFGSSSSDASIAYNESGGFFWILIHSQSQSNPNGCCTYMQHFILLKHDGLNATNVSYFNGTTGGNSLSEHKYTVTKSGYVGIQLPGGGSGTCPTTNGYYSKNRIITASENFSNAQSTNTCNGQFYMIRQESQVVFITNQNTCWEQDQGYRCRGTIHLVSQPSGNSESFTCSASSSSCNPTIHTVLTDSKDTILVDYSSNSHNRRLLWNTSSDSSWLLDRGSGTYGDYNNRAVGFHSTHGILMSNATTMFWQNSTTGVYNSSNVNQSIRTLFPHSISNGYTYTHANLISFDSRGHFMKGELFINPFNGKHTNYAHGYGTNANGVSNLEMDEYSSYYQSGTIYFPDYDRDFYLSANDNCPNSPLNYVGPDYDSDGCYDFEDDDIDGDGILNQFDSFPSDLCGDTDTDGDGKPDVLLCSPSNTTLIEDDNDDNDSFLDSIDLCPVGLTNWSSSTSGLDYDSDGCQDLLEDIDDDNDGVIDVNDLCALGLLRSNITNWTDNDVDGCDDLREDFDDDNDGTPDLQDLWPTDNQAYGNDTDGDGRPDVVHVSNNTLGFPSNSQNWSQPSNSSEGGPSLVANHSSTTALQNQTPLIVTFSGSGEFSFDYLWNGSNCVFSAELNSIQIPLQFGNQSYQTNLVSGNHSLSLNYFENISSGDCNSNNLQLFEYVIPGGSFTSRGLWEDFDDDNDGYSDFDEAMGICVSYSDHLDNTSTPLDLDSDFICDALDEDVDGDGYTNFDDYFPRESSQWNDTDGDGYGDNLTGNNPDIYPNEPSQWNDTDGDGYGDNLTGIDGDAFPYDYNASIDTDGDGMPDLIHGNSTTGLIEDNDDDNDGFNDSIDPWPLDECVGEDHDGDGLADNVQLECQTTVLPDEDDDNDNKLDQDDFCPTGKLNWLSGAVTDNDADGCRDADEDLDDDNDGMLDNVDLCPRGYVGWVSNPSVDQDSDGCHDLIEDNDDDNDGVTEPGDQCPNTPSNVTVDTQGCPIDSDTDGVADYLDNCPNTPVGVLVDTNGCPVDTDDDGVPDYQDEFPNDVNETMDSDGDGVGDNSDAFPNDGNETMDSDGDSVGDNSDAFPNDANETMDSDGDSVGDNSDAFPNDANETMDSDGDAVGDNSDAFPNDANDTMDSDGDAVGDNSDAFPNDANESMDSDGDAVGDNSDAFPNDGNETMDSDGDGLGDNSDQCDETKIGQPVQFNGCVSIQNSFADKISVTSVSLSVLVVGILSGVFLMLRKRSEEIMPSEDETFLNEGFSAKTLSTSGNISLRINQSEPQHTLSVEIDSNEIPSELQGSRGDDGYYWLEWPAHSGSWHYRPTVDEHWKSWSN